MGSGRFECDDGLWTWCAVGQCKGHYKEGKGGVEVRVEVVWVGVQDGGSSDREVPFMVVGVKGCGVGVTVGGGGSGSVECGMGFWRVMPL